MRTTRWQGIATASGLAAQACATARTALRPADGLRDLRVARRLTRRDGAQRLPDLLLEGGAADVERKVEVLAGRLDEADDCRDGALEIGVAADEFRARKPILQVALRAHPDRRRS